jgi:hypothetical protein
MRRALLILSISLGLLACDPTKPFGGAELCACPPARTHAFVSGTLRTETGVSVASVLVRIEAATNGCDFTRYTVWPELESGVLVNGTFSLHLWLGSATRSCLRVRAETRDGAALQGLSEGAEIQFRAEREVPDTLSFAVVMTAPT